MFSEIHLRLDSQRITSMFFFLLHAAGLSEDGQTFDVEEGSGHVDLKDVLNQELNKNEEISKIVDSKKSPQTIEEKQN